MSGLGAGLSSNADMVKFMDEYDLTRQPYSVNTVGVQVLDRHGNEDKEKKWPSGYVQRSTNWDTLYWRMRANFDGLENAYCEVPDGKKGDGEVWYMDGCTVENVEDGGEGKVVVVYTEGGEEKRKIDADLVIATDGPSSKIRQILQPDVERKYVGYCGWRGTVHEKVISAESKEALSHIPTLCPIGNSCTVSSVTSPRSQPY
jgi:2-polyprenyl-6-methoxyphenol hydroxylase-like FAD-dependent oxidoreductase